MVKKHKHKSTKKRCRTAREIEEEQSRTLYIRLPKTIKDVEEVKSLFVGDFKIKLPRQSSRHCHVIFPSIEDKVKNLKEVKQKMMDGKPIVANHPKPINLNKPKKHKKLKMPDPSVTPNVSPYILVSKLPLGTKASEVRDAFPGSITVALLKGVVRGTRQARVKMSSPHVSLQYSKTKSMWPKFKGKRCKVTISQSKKKPRKKKTLKIYDGDTEIKEVEKSWLKPSGKKEVKTEEGKENNESENSSEEQSVEEVESGDESEEEQEEEEEEENDEQEDQESNEKSSE